ncbi:hypothetical protein [Massilia sp. Se16.2.3]|nr:hypothetical protein [Massilia sp. Se16.2.3]QNA98592.1 hypothetical protein G4G31_06675 [Massilia sp. Se16.2.3]
MLPLGYRKAEQDWLVDLAKLRHSLGHFASVIDRFHIAAWDSRINASAIENREY